MGQIIVIAGTDGSGKATQTKILIDRLRESGYKVSTFDFPRYNEKSSTMVSMYLRGEFGSASEVSPHVASMFFAIDRHFAAKDIAKAVESEDFVIMNRYITANMAHQGGKIKDREERNKFLTWLKELEYEKLELPKPDKTVFLYLPPTYGQELVDKKEEREYTQGKKRDIHEDDKQHLEDASEAYQQIAEDHGWLRIDCLKEERLMSVEEISELIWQKLGIESKSETS
jgi:dTMP kinase